MPNTYDLPTDPDNCPSGVVSPSMPCATHNVAVTVIDSYIFRITQEMTKNVSARVTGFSADDKTRMDAFYNELLAKIDELGDTIMDFHGLIFWPLSDLASVQVPVENETINGSLSYLLNADYNLRVSQSARLNDGLLATDKKDLVDAIEKSKLLVDNFYERSNPLDMPQSNPRAPVVTPSGS